MAVVKRLSKVARELNVGISTIVEFLGSQGKEVSSNPNTKIGEGLYMMLLEEYHKEKFEKEKADNVVIDQSERKVISIKKEEPKKEIEKIDIELAQNYEEVSSQPNFFENYKDKKAAVDALMADWEKVEGQISNFS